MHHRSRQVAKKNWNTGSGEAQVDKRACAPQFRQLWLPGYCIIISAEICPVSVTR
jgi:hypothetical protein